MKKALFAVVASMSFASGECQQVFAPPPAEVKNKAFDPKIQLMADMKVIIFANSTMRTIYDQGTYDLQFSMTCPFWRWIHLYAALDYLDTSGTTIEDLEKTSFWEVPLSLGLKPTFKISAKAAYFFALGAQYIFVHQTNLSTLVDHEVSDHGFGAFAKTGFTFHPLKYMLIDFFGEYSLGWMHVDPTQRNNLIQVSSYSFGGGIGITF